MFYKVFYTNWMVLPASTGTTYGPFIFIRPSAKDNVGMLEHEKTHVAQFWKNPLMGLFYLLSSKARLKYELEAYRVQVKYQPERLDGFAWALAHNYRLGITVEEAKALLSAE